MSEQLRDEMDRWMIDRFPSSQVENYVVREGEGSVSQQAAEAVQTTTSSPLPSPPLRSAPAAVEQGRGGAMDGAFVDRSIDRSIRSFVHSHLIQFHVVAVTPAILSIYLSHPSEIFLSA
jgi:hypothetical protein